MADKEQEGSGYASPLSLLARPSLSTTNSHHESLTYLSQRLSRIRRILYTRHGQRLRRCIRWGGESPRRPRRRRVCLRSQYSRLSLQMLSSSRKLKSIPPTARQPKTSRATSQSSAALSKASATRPSPRK